MGQSLVSDILNMYYPEECMIVNKPIIETMKNYGFVHVPSNCVKRYMLFLEVFKSLRKEAGFPVKNGFALIDNFAWEKAAKK